MAETCEPLILHIYVIDIS